MLIHIYGPQLLHAPRYIIYDASIGTSHAIAISSSLTTSIGTARIEIVMMSSSTANATSGPTIVILLD